MWCLFSESLPEYSRNFYGVVLIRIGLIYLIFGIACLFSDDAMLARFSFLDVLLLEL